MQLIVDNGAGEMMPGDYAGIHLQMATVRPMCSSVPSSALIFDAKGLSVATVGADNRVLLKPVSIGRDLGTIIELASGLSPSDRVIEIPPDGIGNGAQGAPRRRGGRGDKITAKAKTKNENGLRAFFGPARR